MAKIMLVEDDNNLREIYGARLLAEGYEIVAAKDGEEALALAVKEKPDLIISDIMMPKISGFDMLDILRSTPETKNTKVIMMTALSQTEDKERAGKLGADRYLVKSQVTLEDVAKAAKEVLESDGGSGPVAAPVLPAAPAVTPAPVSPAPVAPASTNPVASPPAAAVTASPVGTPADVAAQVNNIINGATNVTTVEPPAATPPAAAPTAPANNEQVLDSAVAAVTPAPAPDASSEQPSGERTNTITPGDHPKTSVHSKVISPINDLSNPGSRLQELLAKEEANTAATTPTPAPEAPTAPADASAATSETPAAPPAPPASPAPEAPTAVVGEVMQIDTDVPTPPPAAPPAPPVAQ